MTKPYVDNGIFRLIGESPTPWPSFVVVVRNDILKKEEESIAKILEVINSVTVDFKDIKGINEIIADEFGQKISDVSKWLSLTEWDDNQLTNKELESVQEKLIQLDLIESKLPSQSILHSF